MAALAHVAIRRPQPGPAPQPARPAEPTPALANGTGAGVPLFLQRHLPGSLPIQPKARVNPPDDAFEREADAVARSAVDGAAAPVAPQTGVAPTVAPLAVQPPDEGAPLGGAVRERVEPVVGRDLSGVRVHEGPAARQTAQALGARAFTHGSHIWLGPGEQADDVPLMAHEAAHVVQQHRSDRAPEIQRVGGPLDERLNFEYEAWTVAAAQFHADGDHENAAYAMRFALMLQGVSGDSFEDERALERFLLEVEADAFSETATLARTGEWALSTNTMAFPRIWSGRVWDALHLDVDEAALEADRLDKQGGIRVTAERVPHEVGEIGLPVVYARALSLASFQLMLRHMSLGRDHVVRDMAFAGHAYMVAGWKSGFYFAWNAMADAFAERVADGEVIVDFFEYTDFVETKRLGLDALGARLGTVDLEEAVANFDDEVVALTNAAFVAGFASMLIGFISARILWEESARLFDEKIGTLDATIAGEDREQKLLRAFRWAYENGYFGAAAEELWNAILAQGWKILGMAAVFIALQFVPIVNVVLDTILLIYAGVDLILALHALYETFAAVSDAQTTVGLQRESARMASSLEGNGLRVLLDVIAIAAALRGIKTKVDRLRGAGLSEEQALRQALAEATGEEAKALRGALARRRIAANFDPAGTLNTLLDRGVSPVVVEQALLSGMSPQRLHELVVAVTDVGRAESIIAFAGRNSAPVNALLDAGLPIARVGEMADLGLGLRHLRALDILLARTRQVAQVEGLVGELVELGAGASEQLIRITPEGLAAVYQSSGRAGLDMVLRHLRAFEILITRTGEVAQVEGLVRTLGELGVAAEGQLVRLTAEGLAGVYEVSGRAGLQTVLDTIALEGRGVIAGFDDWVEFTIVQMNKQGTDLSNALGELTEAQRLAGTLGAGERVRIGLDVGARGPGVRSFDIAVEDAAGNVMRNVEVTTPAGRLEGYGDLSEGIRHAITKAPGAAAGTVEATIRVRITPRFSIGAGRAKVVGPDGTFHIVERNGAIYTRGDVLQQAADNLPKIPGSGQLGRVNVVNVDGPLIGVLENRGGVWVVIR